MPGMVRINLLIPQYFHPMVSISSLLKYRMEQVYGEYQQKEENLRKSGTQITIECLFSAFTQTEIR